MIVSTNGCFDGIHPGHLFLFGFMKGLGNKLIIGLNSDDYIIRKKHRNPHFNLDTRKQILFNLGIFSEIYSFDEDTPNEWLKKVNPDIHCIGEEYALYPAEKNVCDEYCIQLVFVPRIPNLESSKLDSNFLRKFNRLFY